MRKICVISGSRADYWLLKPVIIRLNESKKVDLQIVLTGAHLLTNDDVQDDLKRSHIIDVTRVDCVMASDEPVAVTKSLGVGILGFAELFHKRSPDLVLVLGDRYEILAAVSACLIFTIPVGHIHGGEVTRGAFDDAIRHSITKMSHLHFVSTEKYRQRVIQLGENPENVFNYGSLGVENIKNTKLLNKKDLENELLIQFQKVNILITFHPITLDEMPSISGLNELLLAVSQIPDACLIFTSPNVDTEGKALKARIIDFVAERRHAYFFESLGLTNYLSVLGQVDCVVGNSSSAIIEAPSLGVGVVNVGIRQAGREMSESVVTCGSFCRDIVKALDKVLSDDFRSSLTYSKNIYEGDRTSQKITNVLESVPLDGIVQKRFFDVKRATQ